jgi:glycolate oxidase FAD binding subunit
MDAALNRIAERIRGATRQLRIRAGGSKDFYGNAPTGEILDPRELKGVLAYEPSELYLRALCGTPLAEIEALLLRQGQMLAFEPPHFGALATVGGCIAAGLSGPRRAANGVAQGGVRDHVLGLQMIDGRGQLLRFGGSVIKNVAGYDVSRLLAGSLGILGLITEVTLRVLPQPAAEMTLRLACDEAGALEQFNQWAGKPLPISATLWHEDAIWLRLSGAVTAVRAARSQLGGEETDAADAKALWQSIREQQHRYYDGDLPLWRFSLPAATPALDLPAPHLLEWNGALRWYRTDAPAVGLRALAARHGGHATLFRGRTRSDAAFTPLAPAIRAIHQRLRASFDPSGIFDVARMYPELASPATAGMIHANHFSAPV